MSDQENFGKEDFVKVSRLHDLVFDGLTETLVDFQYGKWITKKMFVYCVFCVISFVVRSKIYYPEISFRGGKYMSTINFCNSFLGLTFTKEMLIV